MVEFKPIKQCLEDKKGNFKGVVIKESDLKAGTSKNGDWTMKIFTFQDETGEVDLAAFNDEIEIFKLGNVYSLENPWWKVRDGKLSLNLGKYCQVEDVEKGTFVNNQELTKEEKEETFKKTFQILEELPAPAKEFVELETVYLLQIEQVVKKVMSEYSNDVNGQKCGMFTKEIYRKMQKSNFMKYGDGFDEPV